MKDGIRQFHSQSMCESGQVPDAPEIFRGISVGFEKTLHAPWITCMRQIFKTSTNDEGADGLDKFGSFSKMFGRVRAFAGFKK